MVDNAPSVGIVRCSKNPLDAREKNIQQRAKSLSLAGAVAAEGRARFYDVTHYADFAYMHDATPTKRHADFRQMSSIWITSKGSTKMVFNNEIWSWSQGRQAGYGNLNLDTRHTGQKYSPIWEYASYFYINRVVYDVR